MAAVDEIAIKLGIKTGDLKAALTDANAQIKSFKKAGESSEDEGFMGQLKGIKKGFGDLKTVLAAGGIATAVQQFFALAIDAAQKSTDATDKNAAAVREFAKGLDEIKGIAGTVAVATVGFFNRIGSAIGDAVNIYLEFFRSGTKALEVWRQNEEAVATTAKAAEAAEKSLADARKKHGAEFTAITKELADIEKKSQEQRLKGLTTFETMTNLQGKLNELLDKQASGDLDAITRRRLAVDIAKTQLSLDETRLTLQKEQAAEVKRAAEESQKEREKATKAAEDLAKRRALDKEQELELFTLQRKRADQLTDADKSRLQILVLQKEERAKLVAVEDLLEKKIKGTLTPAEAQLLAELIKQSETLARQITQKTELANVAKTVQLPTEQAITSEMEEQARQAAIIAGETERAAQIEKSRSGTITQTGDVRNLSDVQLKALQSKLGQKLVPIQQNDREMGGVGLAIGTFKSIEQLMLSQNLEAVQRELEARRAFENTVKNLGLQYAERTFSPDEFSRLSSLLNPDLQKQQARDIGKLTAGLERVFPKAFNDIRGGP